MGARQPPLVGRTDVLGELARQVASGGSVLIAGPAGIGKTRLAREICRLEVARGGVVERALATAEGASRPLGTLLPLGVLAEGDDRVTAFGRVLRAWADGRGPCGPVLLWLDDAHHTDPATAALIRHGAVGGVIRLLATHRDHLDLPVDLEALVTEGVLDRHRLGPLADRDAVRLAQSTAAPHLLTPAQRSSIAALAQGNPLYVRELARAAVRGDPDLAGAPALDLLVGRAVLGLEPATREVLEMVAVAEPAPRGLFSSSRDELLRLRAAGLVEAQGDGTVRTDHPLRRAWLLRELGPHRHEVLGALLDEVEQSPEHAPDALTLLGWFEDAERAPGADLVERAARSALAQGELERARSIAARLGGGLGEFLAAVATALGGDLTTGLAELDRLAAEAELPVRIEAALWSARFHGLLLGDLARAEEIVSALDGLGEADPDVAFAALRTRLWIWTYRSPPLGGDLVHLAGRVSAWSDPPAAVEAGSALAVILLNLTSPSVLGDLMEALARHEAALGEWSPVRASAAAARAWYEMALLRGDGAARVAEAGLSEAERAHDLEGMAVVSGSAAGIVAACGRTDRALELGAARPGFPDVIPWFRLADLRRAVHAGNLCYAGDVTGAAALYDALMTTDPFEAPHPLTMLLARAHRLIAESGGAAWDPGLFVGGVESAASARKLLFIALAALECVDLTAGGDVIEACLRATHPVDTGLCALAASSFEARLSGDAATVAGVAARLEEGGIVVPALRTASDVVRLTTPGEVEHAQARARILRLLPRWEGIDPWWVDDLPTPRQREVAGLVASGGTATDVAHALVLSRRTVENHLQRVYEFLGVHSRGELVDALAPPVR